MAQLKATGVTGSLEVINAYITGSITGSDAKFTSITGSLQGNATNVTTTADTTDAVRYIPFVDNSTTSNQALKVDSDLKYNPSTNKLTVANLAGTTIVEFDAESYVAGASIDDPNWISSTSDIISVGASSPYTGKKFLVLRNQTAGQRFLQSKRKFSGDVDVSYLGVRSYSGIYDSTGLNLEAADTGDNLVLQYSTNGATWTDYQTLMLGGGTGTNASSSSDTVTMTGIAVPYYIRFSQTFTAGAFDHYALADISLTSSTALLAVDGDISASVFIGSLDGNASTVTNGVYTTNISSYATTAVTAGTGLSGGGTVGSLTLDLDFSELTDKTTDITGTTEFILQDGTTESRKAASEIKLSVFNNDSGWTSNTGTITSIATNNGVTGGTITTTGTIGLTGQALALHTLLTNGLIARTDTDTVAGRTIAGGTGITVTNGDGVSGNPSIALTSDSLTIGSNLISLGGTVTTIAGLSSVTSTGFTGSLNGNASTVTNGVYTTGNQTIGGIKTFSSQILTSTGTTATAPAFARSTDTNTGIFFPAADELAIATGGAEEIRIKADGKIGIGVSTPDSLLHVHTGPAGTVTADTNTVLTVENNNDSYISLLAPNANSCGLIFGFPTSNSRAAISYLGPKNALLPDTLAFLQSGSLTRMIITGPDGNVGIGTTSPDQKLHVQGTILSAVESTGNNINIEIRKTTAVSNSNIAYRFSHRSNGTDLWFYASNGAGTFRNFFGTNWTANKVLFPADGTDLVVDMNNGRVGVNKLDPGARLHVKSVGHAYDGLRLEETDSTSYWDIYYGSNGQAGIIDDNLYFSKQNNYLLGGYLDDAVNVANIDFTGQHRSLPSSGTVESFVDKIGLIVVSSGEYINFEGHNGININEALPKVQLSNARNQKSCFGVISDSEDPNTEGRVYYQGRWASLFEKPSDDNRLIINSLGEGGIWVCNINGNLENGDYITTCEVPGYGMKQDSEFVANYTVAKITCDCDFDLESPIYMCEEFQWEGQTYRKAFVGCTYHCG